MSSPKPDSYAAPADAAATAENPLKGESPEETETEKESKKAAFKDKLGGFKDSASAFGAKTYSGMKTASQEMTKNPNRDPNAATGEFSTPILDCFDDIGNCLFVHCCFFFAALQHSRDMGQMGSIWCGIITCSICGGANRGADRWRLKKKYGIEEAWLSTQLIMWLCPGLALMQEMREVKMRGGYEPLFRDLTTPIKELAGGRG